MVGYLLCQHCCLSRILPASSGVTWSTAQCISSECSWRLLATHNVAQRSVVLLICSSLAQGHSIFACSFCSSEQLLWFYSSFYSVLFLLLFCLVPHLNSISESVTPLPFISNLPVTSELISKKLGATGLRFFMLRFLFGKLCIPVGESNFCLREFRSLLHCHADLQSCFSLWCSCKFLFLRNLTRFTIGSCLFLTAAQAHSLK